MGQFVELGTGVDRDERRAIVRVLLTDAQLTAHETASNRCIAAA